VEMNKDRVDVIKQYTYMTYCRDRDEVESEIRAKYKKAEEPAPSPAGMPGGLGDLF